MRINFRALGRISAEEGARCIAYSRSLGLPYFKEGRGLGPLAVVAGGPSIKNREEELRYFGGDIWGVNGAFEWLYRHDVKSTFFTLDPPTHVSHYPPDMCGLVASSCPTEFFDQLNGRNLTLFDVNCPGGISTGATGVTAIPILAGRMGYGPVTFYGCEGSFEGDDTHAYPYSPPVNMLVVECNGQQFATQADFLMQTEVLSALIRQFPNVYAERSGGLLSAMVADPDYDIVGLSHNLRSLLVPQLPNSKPRKTVLDTADLDGQ
jgi:hypothetical protein